MKQFTNLNAVLNVDALESADESVSLNEGQLQLIESALEQTDIIQIALDLARADSLLATTELQTSIDALTAERDAAVANFAGAWSAFDAIHQSVADATTDTAKADAIRTLLSAIPGASATGILDTTDPLASSNTDADWEIINSLPHNQNVK